MKLKRMIVCLAMIGIVLFEMVFCHASAERSSFADAFFGEVSVSDPQRVGIASGSLAECRMLAGGEVCAVTRDAEDRNLELPEDVIDLGSMKDLLNCLRWAMKPPLCPLNCRWALFWPSSAGTAAAKQRC